MDTKEKVIKESIRRIEKRDKKLAELIDANHISAILENRKKVNEILIAHISDNETLFKLITPLAEEEKKLIALSKKQSANTIKWIEERARLNAELGQLQSELFFHNRRRFVG